MAVGLYTAMDIARWLSDIKVCDAGVHFAIEHEYLTPEQMILQVSEPTWILYLYVKIHELEVGRSEMTDYEKKLIRHYIADYRGLIASKVLGLTYMSGYNSKTMMMYLTHQQKEDACKVLLEHLQDFILIRGRYHYERHKRSNWDSTSPNR